MQYELMDAADAALILARGQSSQVFYDYRTNRSRPIPEDVLRLLESYRPQP